MRPWLVVAVAFLGCVAGPGKVGLRPDGSPLPEECPKKALEAMELLRLGVGDEEWIDVDMAQVGTRDAIVYDGPIESSLQDSLGPLETRTRVYGWVWTRGPFVVIRYYEARPLDKGRPIPICGVARLDNGQLQKKSVPFPGSAVTESVARLRIVDGFR